MSGFFSQAGPPGSSAGNMLSECTVSTALQPALLHRHTLAALRQDAALCTCRVCWRM